MNKAEVISAIAEDTGLTKKAVADVLNAQERVAGETLAKGEEFAIPGIGKLVVQQQAARKGRNPSTGTTLELPARRVVKARLSSGIKAIVA